VGKGSGLGYSSPDEGNKEVKSIIRSKRMQQSGREGGEE